MSSHLVPLLELINHADDPNAERGGACAAQQGSRRPGGRRAVLGTRQCLTRAAGRRAARSCAGGERGGAAAGHRGCGGLRQRAV